MGQEARYSVRAKTNIADSWRAQICHAKKPQITSGCIVVTYSAEADVDVKRFMLFFVQNIIAIPLLPSICKHIGPGF